MHQSGQLPNPPCFVYLPYYVHPSLCTHHNIPVSHANPTMTGAQASFYRGGASTTTRITTYLGRYLLWYLDYVKLHSTVMYYINTGYAEW